MTDRVVHVNDGVPDAIYIGRAVPRRGLKASPFANPYPVSGHGRDDALALYERYLRGVNRGLLVVLPRLRDKPLACWCRRDGEPITDANACHGDLLVHLLDTYDDDELRAMAGEQP